MRDALVALAPALSPDLWEDAVQLARSIQYVPNRIEPLAALCGRAPEEKRGDIAREALEAIRTLEYDSSKPQKLAAISAGLPAEQMATALEIALSIRAADDRAAALSALVPHLPGALFAAARSAVESLDGAYREVAEAFMTLAKALPASEQYESWHKALAVAGDLKNEHAGESLARLLPELPSELLPQAVEIARRLTPSRYAAITASNRAFCFSRDGWRSGWCWICVGGAASRTDEPSRPSNSVGSLSSSVESEGNSTWPKT